MIPRFAVVGHTNEGKSSVVATLTEDDSIRIGEEAGTTREVQEIRFEVDGEALFAIVDTPGFEQAPAVLEWLRSVPVNASERRQRVQEFVRTFSGTDKCREEVKLLRPILDGAVILYVVDGSHPYRPIYEDELEILRWTGAPSLGLINRIRDRDHVEEWRRALNQYFKIVRVFDAHRGRFAERLELLKDLQALSPELKADLENAVRYLVNDRERRLDQAATEIARRSMEMIAHRKVVRGNPETLGLVERDRAVDAFHDELRQMEGHMREALADLFRHRRLSYHEDDLGTPVYEQDLFAEKTWDVFGLSPKTLVGVATMAGAAAGGTIDAAVGGHSFMLGAAIGAALGGGLTFLRLYSDPLARGAFAGESFVIGPHRGPNFPWIVVDRAVVFTKALLSRTHAKRDVLDLRSGKLGEVNLLTRDRLRRLGGLFDKARRSGPTAKLVAELAAEIRPLLED